MATSSPASPFFTTDLRVSLYPAIDQTKYPDIYDDGQLVHSAIRSLQGYLDLYTGARVQCIATETIKAGFMVNLWNNSGVYAAARNATNAAAASQCDGYCTQDCIAGDTIEIQTFGVHDLISGLTPGIRYYLGTAGGLLSTAPTTAGTIAQEIGVALSSSALLFRPSGSWKQN